MDASVEWLGPWRFKATPEEYACNLSSLHLNDKVDLVIISNVFYWLAEKDI